MKVKRVFVNLTAHDLLPEQVEAAKKELGIEEFLDAKDILPEEVVRGLRQCPDTVPELYDLVERVIVALDDYAEERGVWLYVHLPAGSPAFTWLLHDYLPGERTVPVFSHSCRVVEEFRNPDGTVTKKSTFRFERFILPDGDEPPISLTNEEAPAGRLVRHHDRGGDGMSCKCARCGKVEVPNEGELCPDCQVEAWKEEVELWEKEIEEMEKEQGHRWP